MQGSMSASQEEIDWVLTSYIVAAAIMTGPVGFFAARFGLTRLFVTSILGFTVASVCCGMAQSLDQIVLFRLLQGMFGAAVVPLSQSVIFQIYPPERRGPVMALWGVGVMLGPVAGPILGGWLTAEYNWRWVFYINIPFGLLAAAGLLAFLKETAHGKEVKLDWLGFGALSLAIGSFQLLLDRGETLDWFASREIIVEACLSGLGLYIFLVQFWLAPKPFINPAIFRDSNFIIGNVLIFVNGMVMYATIALLSPYLQVLMNYPVLSAGVVLAPRGAGIALAATICGRLLGRVGPRLLVGFGLTLGAAVMLEMTGWTPDVSAETVFIAGFVQGVSIGFLSLPLNITAFSTLSAELRTEGTAIFSLIRNLGSAIGISVTGVVLATNTQVNHAILAGQINPFDRNFAGAVARLWNPGAANGAAALNAVLSRQASIIAYIDDFKMLLVMCLVALPLVLLLRPIRSVS
jgi:DHA2 family multidrug resistance protein